MRKCVVNNKTIAIASHYWFQCLLRSKTGRVLYNTFSYFMYIQCVYVYSLACSAIVFHRCRASNPAGQLFTINECSSGEVMSIESAEVGFTQVLFTNSRTLLSLQLFLFRTNAAGQRSTMLLCCCVDGRNYNKDFQAGERSMTLSLSARAISSDQFNPNYVSFIIFVTQIVWSQDSRSTRWFVVASSSSL